jgi:subtilisin family serine protease
VLTNTTNEPIEWWELTFDSNFTITDMLASWAASYITHGNGRYTFKGTYTGIIQPNSSVVLGFQATKDGDPQISAERLTEVVVCESSFADTDTVEYETKRFSNATIEDNFCGSSVLVMLDRSISGINKFHEPSFFGDFPVTSILDLTWHSSEEEIERMQDSMENFRQILRFVLPEYCKENVLEVIGILEQVEGVLCAEPNLYLYLNTATPESSASSGIMNWSEIPNAWDNFDKVSVPAAREITTGDTDILVGVIDTGISYHPDLRGRVNYELGRGYHFDFTTGEVVESLTADDSAGFGGFIGHGTQVAGVINSIADVTLVPLVYDNTVASVVASIMQAQRAGIQIINFSGGFRSTHFELGNEMRTVDMGAFYESINNFPGLLVVSADNNGVLGLNPETDEVEVDRNLDRIPYWPASFRLSNVIVVSNSDENDEIATINGNLAATFGERTVHLFAPGMNIASTCGVQRICENCVDDVSNLHISDRMCKVECTVSFSCGVCDGCEDDNECESPHHYCVVNGTSFAAPHVTGVAALILSVFPDATAEEIKMAILAGVDKFEQLEELCVTGGRLNAYGALLAAQRLIGEMLQISDADAFGNWVVIYNPTNRRLSTRGLYLSNSSDDLFMWRLPAVILEPDTTILVVGIDSDVIPDLKWVRANFNISFGDTILLVHYADGVVWYYDL